jgi:deoxyribodipyrimidine photolyase-related protein
MEYFYREMRVRYGILLTDTKEPEGGHWNYDAENRGAFGTDGPVDIHPPINFPPDSITRQVMALVESRFPNHPGELTHFDWPVTTEEANSLLDDFIENRLPLFGQYQDALWAPTLLNKGSAYLAHSKLSAAINLKLLLPLTVIKAVEEAYRKGHVSLASAEGFIRQVLGWREFIRGIYWLHMPHYLSMNALEAHTLLPAFYWTGDTEMACLRHTIGQTLEYGYAHHIQRLMITGLYALLLGVGPKQVHEWYLAMYVDAVEWVELPNSLGMSQFADGGIFASKPYIASGKYIQKMSNYCKNCAFKPDVKTGPTACPITTLYWDFLIRHYDRFINHPRLALQVRNVTRLSSDEKDRISQAATIHRKSVTQ